MPLLFCKACIRFALRSFVVSSGRTTSLKWSYLHRAPLRCLTTETTSEFPSDFTNQAAENKTSVNILNESKDGIFFKAFAPYGFTLSNELRVLGPVIAFPQSIYYWNITGADDITPSSLRLFTTLYPKLDLLIIGKGEKRSSVSIEPIHEYLRKHKINFEILPTHQALTTFNFLNSESRYVAAALLPPAYMGNFEEETKALLKNKQNRFLFSESSDNPQILFLDQLKLDLDVGSISPARKVPTSEIIQRKMDYESASQKRRIRASEKVQEEMKKSLEELNETSEFDKADKPKKS